MDDAVEIPRALRSATTVARKRRGALRGRRPVDGRRGGHEGAELAGSRLSAVVLVDVAGRVDPGVGPVVAASMGRLDRVYDSAEHYVDEVRSQGLIAPWSDHWDGAYRYELRETDGRVRPRTDPGAVREDRAYTATQDP